MGVLKTEGCATQVLSIDLTGSRRRQDYLRQLGIGDDKQARFARKPWTTPSQEPLDDDSTLGNSWRLGHGFIADDNLSGACAFHVDKLNGQDDFRINFLRKLAYSKVWVPQVQRPPKHQTVIVFDWDDTLLCTSYLNSHRDDRLPRHVEQHVRSIQQVARHLLERALQAGHTFIITNATSGWVEYSAARWAPEFLPVLQTVRVISARSKYEPQFPGQVGKWKTEAFLEVQRKLNSQIITNLISIGDSKFEMDAVHFMAKKFDQALIKTVKLREYPSPEELHKQLELVFQKFEPIIENARNLKLCAALL
mmetsp:Transcript_116575/g.226741  ORF Transcript_116575/g.226741 Transcript_116575/m.226741 type:complete len:308 (-) Transcript_116575:218-1141(-)